MTLTRDGLYHGAAGQLVNKRHIWGLFDLVAVCVGYYILLGVGSYGFAVL